jgi:hypothetical protein
MVIDGSANTITGLAAGGLPDASITAADLATEAKPIGVGQTWQNMTASRSPGTTYTNTTGRPIQILVRLETYTLGTGSTYTTLTINGNVVGCFGGRNDTAIQYYTHSAIIAPNDTYHIGNGAGTMTYTSWYELRG